MKSKIRRLGRSLFYSFKGLRKVYREEQNFKIQIFVLIFVLALGAYFKISRFDWLALVFVSFLVLIMETINSAVERMSDVLKPRIDKYVKEIKDITAGAVMLSAILAIVVGILIFAPYFRALFF